MDVSQELEEGIDVSRKGKEGWVVVVMIDRQKRDVMRSWVVTRRYERVVR